MGLSFWDFAAFCGPTWGGPTWVLQPPWQDTYGSRLCDGTGRQAWDGVSDRSDLVDKLCPKLESCLQAACYPKTCFLLFLRKEDLVFVCETDNIFRSPTQIASTQAILRSAGQAGLLRSEVRAKMCQDGEGHGALTNFLPTGKVTNCSTSITAKKRDPKVYFAFERGFIDQWTQKDLH